MPLLYATFRIPINDEQALLMKDMEKLCEGAETSIKIEAERQGLEVVGDIKVVDKHTHYKGQDPKTSSCNGCSNVSINEDSI